MGWINKVKHVWKKIYCNHDKALLLQRVFFGSLLFFGHGLDKVTHFSVLKLSFPDPIGWGSTLSVLVVIFAEFVCAGLVVLGIFTRWACIPVIGLMGFIAFVFHGDDPWNKKELAILYLCAFLVIALLGEGRYTAKYYFNKVRNKFS